jgi:soluble P-type ATPase
MEAERYERLVEAIADTIETFSHTGRFGYKELMDTAVAIVVATRDEKPLRDGRRTLNDYARIVEAAWRVAAADASPIERAEIIVDMLKDAELVRV